MHILGYLFDPQHEPLQAFLAKVPGCTPAVLYLHVEDIVASPVA
jgi:hypothetical protein